MTGTATDTVNTAHTKHIPNFKPAKLFARLHSNDRGVYDALIGLSNTNPDSKTTREIYVEIQRLSYGQMHNALRTRLNKLLMKRVTRNSLNEMITGYEEMLLKLSPEILPNETPVEYFSRTNLPSAVIDQVFNDSRLVEDYSDDELF